MAAVIPAMPPPMIATSKDIFFIVSSPWVDAKRQHAVYIAALFDAVKKGCEFARIHESGFAGRYRAFFNDQDGGHTFRAQAGRSLGIFFGVQLEKRGLLALSAEFFYDLLHVLAVRAKLF